MLTSQVLHWSAVLDALAPQVNEMVAVLKQEIDTDDCVLIKVEQVRRQLPFLDTCRTQPIYEIDHDDWLPVER